MIGPTSTGEEILAALVWYFDQYPHPFQRRMHDLLEQSACKVDVNLSTLLNQWESHPHPTEYKLKFWVPAEHLEFATGDGFHEGICEAFDPLVTDEGPYRVYTVVKVMPPNEVRTIGLNNCYFKQERTILHDELRFRSKGEVAIYDELKQRNILLFPNPAAVMGTTGQEFGAAVDKKEPDFLICSQGKWGILEINGDDYHSGIVKTTKDHERARRFNRYGVFFIQAYDADKCKSDPVGVVDEFLSLLARHK